MNLQQIAKEICQRRDYTFDRYVARGSYKELYRVYDQSGIVRALKIFLNASHERNQIEITSMRRCDHPNIARLLLVDTESIAGKQYLFLIEDFIDGGTLSSRIQTSPLRDRDLYVLGLQMTDALCHLEACNLVHRDIKPDNILINTETGAYILSDFGMVRDLQASSVTASWQPRGPGTALYSSYEQLTNIRQLMNHHKTDQFALGVVLSFCSPFRKHPYDYGDGNPIEMMINKQQPSPAFTTYIRETPFKIIEKMVSLWPHGRYPNALAVHHAWKDIGGMV